MLSKQLQLDNIFKKEEVISKEFMSSHLNRSFYQIIETISLLNRDFKNLLTNMSYSNFNYAILHHILYELQLMASKNNTDSLNNMLSILSYCTEYNDSFFAQIANNIYHYKDCNKHIDNKFESSLFCLNLKAIKNPSDSIYLTSAFSLLEKTHLFFFVKLCFGALILLDPDKNYNITSSYTVAVLPKTIYCTPTKLKSRMAEQILHELTHTWLNELIYSMKIDFNNMPLLYSPWKKTKRSIYGVLHAGYAFSLMYILFYQIISSNLDAESENYLQLRLKNDKELLHQGYESVSKALSIIDNEVVSSVILHKYSSALSICEIF